MSINYMHKIEEEFLDFFEKYIDEHRADHKAFIERENHLWFKIPSKDRKKINDFEHEQIYKALIVFKKII